MKRLCVFCGSATGKPALYRDQARELGKEMVQHGWSLVYGAGHIGLMGVLADSVLAAGGEAIGVIPQALVDRELAHRGLTELEIVGTMHERKARMAHLADAFAALPGGFGTCDELFEILTWAQLKIHQKPVGLLNTGGFFDPLLGWMNRLVEDGFLKPHHRDLVRVASSPIDLLELINRPASEFPEKIEPPAP